MVARVLGYILHKLGLISINKVIEVQRTDLVGGYVGQTGLKTREKIDEAKGGILFVDEAYRLMPTDSRRDFGIETLEEIMQAMDNGEVVTIFAGYGKDMEHMISANEGFPRRVSKLGKLKCKDADDSVQDVKADDLRQMFLAMTEEVRVIIVKLADRLHNMRTLAHMPQHKQSSIALETLQVFAPLAKLLGMYQFKSELEYLSFMYTNAYDFTELKKRVDGLYKEHERELQEANKILRQGIEKDKFLELVTVKTEVHSVCKELYRFAEMPKEEKNKISHRSKALALVKSHFASAGNEFQTDGEP